MELTNLQQTNLQSTAVDIKTASDLDGGGCFSVTRFVANLFVSESRNWILISRHYTFHESIVVYRIQSRYRTTSSSPEGSKRKRAKHQRKLSLSYERNWDQYPMGENVMDASVAGLAVVSFNIPYSISRLFSRQSALGGRNSLCFYAKTRKCPFRFEVES